MNEKNLRKLAKYLEKLPASYPHFSMFDYVSDGTQPQEAHEFECGTVACAVGHGPAAGIKPKKEEGWCEYEDRVFALAKSEWDWCFASEWRITDNTPQGAAKRILYMLEHGVPADYHAQMIGDEPYIFNEEKQA